jgi:hypothetical protein
LRYDKNQWGALRRIMISDNSAVYVSTFGVLPYGQVHGPGSKLLHTAFPRDPSRVTKPQIDVDKWIGNAGDDIRVEELAEGGYTIHVRRDKIHESCTALKRFDFNISSRRVEIEGRRNYLQQEQLTWKKAGDIWYVANFEEILKTSQGQYRTLLRFNEFTANAAISPKLFQLSALELPAGAGILDHRENADPRWHRYQIIPEDGSRRFFDMEAELESLPGR